jgi:hypothetical protein
MDDRTKDQMSPTDPTLSKKMDAADGRPWQSGLLKHLPWTGLLSLLVEHPCIGLKLMFVPDLDFGVETQNIMRHGIARSSNKVD